MLNVNDVNQIYLGCQGENLARTIVIDVKPWLVKYPDGIVAIYHKRNGAEEATPTGAVFDAEKGTVTWKPTSTDTYVFGEGEAEIRLTEGTVIKKSRDVKTDVAKSVTGKDGEALGSGWQEYLDAIQRAAGVAIIKNGQIRFAINSAGHLILSYTDDVPIPADENEETTEAGDVVWTDKDLGPVDVYAEAVAAGYEGTKEEWLLEVGSVKENAQAAAGSATAAAGSETAAAGSATQAAGSAASAAESAADALQHTQSVIETWLGNNIDPESGYALDRTLALPSAAAPADMVGDLKSAFDYATGEFYYVTGRTETSTTNLYCDKDMELAEGDKIRVTILGWSHPSNNRASISVYARANSNVKLGGISANTPIPSDTYEYKIPAGTFTGIRVNLKSSSAAQGATGAILIEKLTGSYIEKKLDKIGYAFDITATSSESTYIYCDKTIALYGGNKIAVKPVYWSTSKRQSIKVYLFAGEESTLLGDIPVPYSDGFYIFDIPEGYYDTVRVSFKNTELDGTTECRVMIIDATENNLTRFFADAYNADRLSGIKINCLGDSLTYGYVPSDYGSSPMEPTWCEQLAADLQCTVRNYGITNNAVSNNSGGSGDPMCIRYSAMDNDADIVIVMGGTNDFLRVNAPLGTIDSSDNTTFYGAYNVLVQGLIAKYKERKARIILMVPPMRNRSNEHNTQGTTLQQIQQAVRDIANKYALPLVDWAYDSGISAYLISNDTDHIYTYDGIHITKQIVLGWILPMIETKVKEVLL